MVSAPPSKEKDAKDTPNGTAEPAKKDAKKDSGRARPTLDSIKVAKPKKPTDEGIDAVVDDEFEDFPADEWEAGPDGEEQQWEDSWADEVEEEDFAAVLAKEHAKAGGAQPMKI
ncbi:hypothetical protein DFJ74DRAFT_700956 [Hyaloraphidium curvatum]|nr:hypothetical protein DFJ74DRAFT_700956 [Hyaloraphidium curvatum]